MRQFMNDERGFSMVTVMGVMLFVIIGLSVVVMLAPQYVRKARLEQDVVLALHAAESGLNHALARIDHDLGSGGDLQQWFDAHKEDGAIVLSSSESDISGQYTVTIEPVSGQGSSLRIQSVGAYGGVTRTVELVASSAGGVMFPEALVSTRPGSKFYREDYEITEVDVPTPGDPTSLPSCETVPTSVGEKISGEHNPTPCSLYLEDSQLPPDFIIENATVYFPDPEVNLLSNFEFRNATIYTSGNLTIGDRGQTDASKPTVGRLYGENRVYVPGMLKLEGFVDLEGEGLTKGLDAPWNFFYAGNTIRFSMAGTIGSYVDEFRSVPDMLFLSSTKVEYLGWLGEMISTDLRCACGIYSPNNWISVSGYFNMVGGMVSYDFIMHAYHEDTIHHAPDRMSQLSPGGGSEFTLSPWKEVY